MTVPNFVKKENDYEWIIPKTHKPGMRVPAKIFASEKIVAEMDSMVYDQVTNVATLPGIINYAYCMPDGHSGYGFPIGGVAAMDINDNGVISPGGIGFDINCLHPNARILTHYGYYRKIKDMSRNLSEEISFMDLSAKSKEKGKSVLFLRKQLNTDMLRIETETGESILLSSDHPLFDGSLFKEARQMAKGDSIVIHPFVGVEYEEPSSEIVVDEDAIVKIVGNRPKLVSELKEKGLLPLRYNSEKLTILAKLIGFMTGDGWIGSYYSEKRQMDIWAARAIGKPDDLIDLKKDIETLGYKANYTSTKHYESTVSELDGKRRKISGNSTQLFIVSQSLPVLLHALGVPKGNKSRVRTEVPKWIKTAPLWIKRLYLAGLFGAELTKSAQRKGENYGFLEPSFSQNKIKDLEEDNMNFMLDIINMLLEFGVVTNKIYKQDGIINTRGEETHKLSIRISSKPENLTRLWGTVGYEYSKERTNLSMLALAYINYKTSFIKKMSRILNEKNALTVVNKIGEISIKNRTIESHIKGRSKEIRISQSFPTFAEFSKIRKIEGSPFIIDRVYEVSKVDYNGYVYDFTMGNENHNFIANSIVSHNCGMRLITTNLTLKDVKPKLKELVDLLFQRVPAGVGSRGFVKFTVPEFKQAIELGAKWCVDHGYGWEEDLERIEENGTMQGADASKVSKKSIERGIDQVGTLGSGNHYLEIQVVKPENIIDKDIAKTFGITMDNQIVIMFHCGSRGFGHQVATDYLNVFLSVMERKYKIKILDRELACAPFTSPEGQDYFAAMKCGINMSFANRQVILHRIREAFSKIFGRSAEEMEMHCVYDVAHNTAKLEKHKIDGGMKEVLVHRKGATRAFGPGREEVPKAFRHVGQPVIIGGSMETGSYLLAGTQGAMEKTFGTTAHGSGRTMSRTQAKRMFRGDKLARDMEQRGIYVRTASFAGLAEEAGAAYKDIDEVINASQNAGISKKVVKLIPIGNVKG